LNTFIFPAYDEIYIKEIYKDLESKDLIAEFQATKKCLEFLLSEEVVKCNPLLLEYADYLFNTMLCIISERFVLQYFK
jgi:hypothetical protein